MSISIWILALAAVLQTGQKTEPKQPTKLDRLARDLRTSKQASERVKAAEQIGEYREKARGKTRELCAAMLDKSPAVRQAATEAVENVNPKFHAAVLPILVDSQLSVRCKSIEALNGEKLDFNPAHAVPALVYRFTASSTAYTSDSELVACVEVMTKIAPDDKEVISAVSTACQSRFENVRLAGIQCLALVKPEDDLKRVGLLVQAIRNDGHFLNRAAAAKSLEKIGSKEKSVVDALRQAKADANSEVRDAATHALESIQK